MESRLRLSMQSFASSIRKYLTLCDDNGWILFVTLTQKSRCMSTFIIIISKSYNQVV